MSTIPKIRLTSNKYKYDYLFSSKESEPRNILVSETLELFFTVIGEKLGAPLLKKQLNLVLEGKGGNHYQSPANLHLNANGLTEWTIVHELGHALDAAYGWRLSKQMQEITGSGFLSKALHIAHPGWKLFWYRVGSPPPPCGIDKNFNPVEDFAETVTAYIFPEEAHRRADARGYPYEKWGYGHFHATPRGLFFSNLIKLENQTALFS